MILIIGTPGVGKTAVSRILASRLPATHIDLTELVREADLISGFDKERATLIADIPRVHERVKEIIERSKIDVILDGDYAVDVVPSEEVHLVFVLRRNPDELKRLLKSYGFEKNKLWENLAAEILDVCLWDAISTCGPEKVCEIDTSGKSARKVAEQILIILEGRGNCERGIVDWLGDLEKEGRLQDFLSHFQSIPVSE